MMKKKKDLRVIKTDQNIKASFIRLVERKGFPKVTVQNILDEAMINRTTFYNHFSSKYELAEIMVGEILEKFDALLDARFGQEMTSGNLYQRLDYVGRELYADGKMILVMWNVHTENVNLYEEMCEHLRMRIAAHLDQNADTFQSQLAVAILMTMIKHMLQDDHVTALELHNQVTDFFRSNLIV